MMKFGSVGVFSVFNWNPNRKSLPGVALWNHCNVAGQLSTWEKLEHRAWWLRPNGQRDIDGAYTNAAAGELDKVLAEWKPQLVVFEELWVYRYLPLVKRYGCPIIFNTHNVEARLFEDISRSFEDLKSKVRANIELFHIKSIERDFIRQVNQVWTCSDEDAHLLNDMYGQTPHTYVVPNGINVASYEEVRLGKYTPASGLEQTSRTLLFVGSFPYVPNRQAAELLINQIYPQLREVYPDCRLLLVGRKPTQRMQELAKREPGIIITGGVPDVRPYLAAASAVVIPLLQGGGTRLKILEAFAAGRPVVSTAKGAEGLRVRDGEHLLIRNDVEGLVAGVCQLWSNPSLGEKLAHSAYELVQAEYSWEAVGRRVEPAVQKLL